MRCMASPGTARVPQILASLSEVEWRDFAFSGFAEYAGFKRPTAIENDGNRVVFYGETEVNGATVNQFGPSSK